MRRIIGWGQKTVNGRDFVAPVADVIYNNASRRKELPKPVSHPKRYRFLLSLAIGLSFVLLVLHVWFQFNKILDNEYGEFHSRVSAADIDPRFVHLFLLAAKKK